MMKCEKVQDLIITDYIDGQINQQEQDMIEGHLKQCLACSEFLARARATVVAPFDHSETREPPQRIWQHIKEALREQQVEPAPSPLKNFLERLRESLVFPQAVPALATVTILVLITVALPKIIILGGQRLARASQAEQVEYLSYLSGETDNLPENGNGGYGTDIEQYFL